VSLPSVATNTVVDLTAMRAVDVVVVVALDAELGSSEIPSPTELVVDDSVSPLLGLASNDCESSASPALLHAVKRNAASPIADSSRFTRNAGRH